MVGAHQILRNFLLLDQDGGGGAVRGRQPEREQHREQGHHGRRHRDVPAPALQHREVIPDREFIFDGLELARRAHVHCVHLDQRFGTGS
jgi:hypothetical protein